LTFFKNLLTINENAPVELCPNGGITGIYAKDLTCEEIFYSFRIENVDSNNLK
jgi:hypothetical protein